MVSVDQAYMVAHIVLASGLILGWTKIFFDKELE